MKFFIIIYLYFMIGVWVSIMKNDKQIYDLYKSMLSDMPTNQEFTNNKNLEFDREAETFFTEEELIEAKDPSKKKKDNDGFYEVRNPDTGIIEESFVFKRIGGKHRKLTDKEIDQIRENCRYTLVHDFSERNIYHISDKERYENDEFAEISMKLNGIKSAYHKVDQFIEAMRIVYEAIQIAIRPYLYSYSREEIFKMIGKGKVYSTRIIFPKLKGIKKYNIEQLARYIQNPKLNPKDLVPIKHDDDDAIFYEEGEFEEEFNMLFDNREKEILNNLEEEYNNIEEIIDEDDIVDNEELEDDEDMEEENPYNGLTSSIFNPLPDSNEDKQRRIEKIKALQDMIGGVDVKPVSKKFIPTNNMGRNKKHFKKLNKVDKKVYTDMGNIINIINNHRYMSATSNPYFNDYIANDDDLKTHNIIDDMRFHNSWSDNNAVKFYEVALEEEYLDRRASGSIYETLRDVKLQEFYNTLENHGVNVKPIRESMDRFKKEEYDNILQNNRKINKKIDKKITSRIIALNNDPKFKKLIKRTAKKYKEDEDNYGNL